MAINLATLRTPGVFIDEVRKFPPSVAQVETAIPVFIGYTERARLDGRNIFFEPQRITSLLEYSEIFGFAQEEQDILVTIDEQQDVATGRVIREVMTADFDFANGLTPSNHTMFYSLQVYFANGGGPCWIVSVGIYLVYRSPIPAPELTQGLEMAGRVDEPTLIVFPEGQNMDLGEYHTLLQAALLQCEHLGDRFVIMDLHDTGRGFQGPLQSLRITAAVANFRSGNGSVSGLSLDQLKYGAAYFPNVRSTFDYRTEFLGYTANTPNANVIRVVHNVNGQVGTGSENGKLFADLDNRWRAKVRSAVLRLSIYLPPCGAVAGVYARVDSTRGVWKAPANEGLISVEDLAVRIDDDQQRNLNVDDTSGLSINAIRRFEGRGIKIWGSRTLAGNDNEWRYVPVRRFFNMVEESVKKATFQFVFEPNDANTWVKVRGMIENFLVLQWRAGALQGATPEKAYYVRVGLGETMTALDILEGRMIVEIGMAVVRPAEFIILRFSHKMAEA